MRKTRELFQPLSIPSTPFTRREDLKGISITEYNCKALVSPLEALQTLIFENFIDGESDPHNLSTFSCASCRMGENEKAYYILNACTNIQGSICSSSTVQVLYTKSLLI